MSGLLKFFLILGMILIAAPALAADTGMAAKDAGFANVILGRPRRRLPIPHPPRKAPPA